MANYGLKVRAYLQLMRPPNIVTAVADILAGVCVAVSGTLGHGALNNGNEIAHAVLWLLLSTVGLYGGGVVFNDVFDAKLDSLERPERPVPSGRASVRGAIALGSVLFLTGIFSASRVNETALIIATVIAILALSYDAAAKHHAVFGPLNMGLCRAFNLLLGMSLVPGAAEKIWYIGFIPLIYIAAVTMVSRGEVKGGNRVSLRLAALLYAFVIAGVFAVDVQHTHHWLDTLYFLIPFASVIYYPLLSAIKNPQPLIIRNAVKAGVLALILLDASMASGFMGTFFGLAITLLLPISLFLSRVFAVT